MFSPQWPSIILKVLKALMLTTSGGEVHTSSGQGPGSHSMGREALHSGIHGSQPGPDRGSPLSQGSP